MIICVERKRMATDEDKIIPEVIFPPIPEDIDSELRVYLMELEKVLRRSLRGSMFLEDTLQTGILGN